MSTELRPCLVVALQNHCYPIGIVKLVFKLRFFFGWQSLYMDKKQ